MSDTQDSGSEQSQGFVIEAHALDDQTAEALKRLLEGLPNVNMWGYERYRE